MSTSANVSARVRACLAEAVTPTAAAPAVVAVSGGLDSSVLLHVLHFETHEEVPRLVVAHFDHGMRPRSADDARWVAGLCRAWGLDLRSERAREAPSSEGAGRRARYAFLERVRRDAGAPLLLTGHHADDQAETVLFRLLRGAGPRGVAGIPARREPGVVRPLLDCWRAELEEYARCVGLSWREDPSNRAATFARNVLRATVIPELEERVAPGARAGLVRAARLARAEEEGWQSILPALIQPLGVEEEEDRVSFGRHELARLHPAVRARVLRRLSERFGLTLDEARTRVAVDFSGGAASGRRIDLGRGVALRRDLDRLVLYRAGEAALPDRPLEIPSAEPGAGEARLGGLRVPVAWGGPAVPVGLTAAAFEPDRLRFPLCVRARAPGDVIRLYGGTKKVKKLLLERRIPAPLRGRVPLVVDAAGEVLWIPGVAVSRPVGRGALTIGIG